MISGSRPPAAQGLPVPAPIGDGMTYSVTDARLRVGSNATLFSNGSVLATTTITSANTATWTLKDRPADGAALSYSVTARSNPLSATQFQPAWITNRQLLRRAAPRLTNPAEPGSTAVAGRPGTGSAAGTRFGTGYTLRTYSTNQDVLVTGDTMPNGGHSSTKQLAGGYNIVVYACNMSIAGTSGSGKLRFGNAIYDGFANVAWVCGVLWDQGTGIEDDACFFGGNIDPNIPGERKFIAQYCRQLNIHGTHDNHSVRADIGSEGVIVTGTVGSQLATVHAPGHGITSFANTTGGYPHLRVIGTTSILLNEHKNWPIDSIPDADHIVFRVSDPTYLITEYPANGTYTGGYVYGQRRGFGKHGDGFQCYDLNGASLAETNVSGTGIVVNSPTQATITSTGHAITNSLALEFSHKNVYIRNSSLSALNNKAWPLLTVSGSTVTIDITGAGLSSGSSTTGKVSGIGWGMVINEFVVHNWTCRTGYDALIIGMRRDNQCGPKISRFSNFNVEYVPQEFDYFDTGNKALHFGDNDSIDINPRISYVDVFPGSCWLKPDASTTSIKDLVWPDATITLDGITNGLVTTAVNGVEQTRWSPGGRAGTGQIMPGTPPGGDFAPATGPYAPGRNFQWPGCGEEGVSFEVVAATDITLTNASVSENAPVGTTIGWVRAIGPKSNAGIVIDDVTILNDTDNKFEMVLGELRTRATLDYETKTSHQITLKATTRLLGETNPSSRIFTKVVTITVIDEADAAFTPDALANLSRAFDAQSGVTTDGATPARVQTIAAAWGTSQTFNGLGTTAKPIFVSGSGPKGQNYVSVVRSDGASLQTASSVPLTTFDFNILCRFRSTAGATSTAANLFGLFSGNSSNLVAVGGDGTNFNRLAVRSGSNALATVDLSPSLDTTNWHHLRITGDGTTGAVILYQDGVRLGSLTVANTPQTWVSISNFFRVSTNGGVADIDVVAMALYTDIKSNTDETSLNSYFASRRA